MYIQVESLSFFYNRSKEKTLDNFSAWIQKGEVVSILGESGSGKSTILRLIAGLETPTEGRIMIDNKIVSNDNKFVPPEKRGIGMVFQDYALFPHMTVADNVKFGLQHYNRKQKKERLEEVLDLVNLTQFHKRYPYELSGGQQQRVALARAMAPRPSLLLFDEPFSNLDASLQHKIREELRKILKKTGITSIFVTHDEADARALADQVIILKKGKIENVCKPCDMLQPIKIEDDRKRSYQ